MTIAYLIQDFAGSYHVKVNGQIEAFSLSLAKATALAQKRGWELR